jgi:hypothetical protein
MNFKLNLNVKQNNYFDKEYGWGAQSYIHDINIYRKFTIEDLVELREEIGVPNFPASKVNLRGGVEEGSYGTNINVVQVFPDEFLDPEKDIPSLVANNHLVFDSITEVKTNVQTLHECVERQFVTYRDETTGEITSVKVFLKFELDSFLTGWSLDGHPLEYSNY